MDELKEENNFIHLTAALLVLLLALPFSQLFYDGVVRWFTLGLIFLTLIVAYLSLDFGPRWRRFVGTVLGLMIFTTALREILDLGASGILHIILILVFLVSVTYSAARRVLFSGPVDSNKIVGGFAIYLLLGLIWEMLYLIVMHVEPDTFNGIVKGGRWEDNFAEMAYFSFVTLTTLGYGDISPAHPITRALAFLEAVTGTFYMAVVVASLIGARTQPKSDAP